MFSSEFVIKSLFNCSHAAETSRNALNLIIIRMLSSHRATGHPRKPSESSISKTLLSLNRIDHAVRLLHAFRLFFFTSQKSDPANFGHLTSMLMRNAQLNGSTILQRRITCHCICTLLNAINTDHLKNMPTYDNGLDSAHLHGLNHIVSLELLDHVFEALTSPHGSLNTDASSKSFVYQSMFSLIKSSPLLTPQITQLINKQLTEYVDKANDNHLKLEACVRVSSSVMHLQEPIDVLVHCAEVCVSQPGGLVLPQSLELSKTLQSIYATYEKKDTNEMFSVYKKNMLDAQLDKLDDPAHGLKITFQLQMGLLDVLMESAVIKENHKLAKIFSFCYLLHIMYYILTLIKLKVFLNIIKPRCNLNNTFIIYLYLWYDFLSCL